MAVRKHLHRTVPVRPQSARTTFFPPLEEFRMCMAIRMRPHLCRLEANALPPRRQFHPPCAIPASRDRLLSACAPSAFRHLQADILWPFPHRRGSSPNRSPTAGAPVRFVGLPASATVFSAESVARQSARGCAPAVAPARAGKPPKAPD
jgi:hypothetical protein